MFKWPVNYSGPELNVKTIAIVPVCHTLVNVGPLSITSSNDEIDHWVFKG
jgi:hypothetical protein